jgi:hypothetical protein
MIHRFIPLSGLMRPRSLSRLLLIDMTPRMKTVLGQNALEPLSVGRFPPALREKLGTHQAVDWMEALIRHSDSLKRSGLCCLLLDTLQYVEEAEAGRITSGLQQLLQHGIQIVVWDNEKDPVVFGTVPDLGDTEHSIDTCVRSLLQQSQALTQSQRASAERARQARQQANQGFRFPERIFVP